QRKGVRLSVPTLFKSAFKNQALKSNFGFEAAMDDDVKYNVRITAGEEYQSLRFFSEEILHESVSYLGRSNRGIKLLGVEKERADVDPERGLWDRFQEVIDVPPELSAQLNTLAKFCIYAPQTSFLRGVEIESLPVKPVGLLGGGLPQAALTVLNQIHKMKDRASLMDDVLRLIWMPGWASAFTVKQSLADQVSSQVKTGNETLYFKDRFMKGKRDTLSAYDSSEGTLFLLFLAVVLLHAEAPKIFALDNVDNALNPSATRAFLEKLIAVTCEKRFQASGIGPQQVFLTSHNPTSLDAFDLFNEEQRIFVVSREPRTGFTKIERLQPRPGMTPEEWIEIARGKNLSEMWISGLIPNALGSSL
ncbi:MAG: ATP-binding protein, partial [Magnetococcales bacterium]|nr:ATP-binding protein [Magnetococcales bacterium]